MEQRILELWNELIAIDPGLREREDEVKKVIKDLIDERPDAALDPAFERELRERLLAQLSRRRPSPFALRRLLGRSAFRIGVGVAAAFCVASLTLLQFRPWAPSPRAEQGGQSLALGTVNPKAGPESALLPNQAPTTTGSVTARPATATAKPTTTATTTEKSGRARADAASPPAPEPGAISSPDDELLAAPEQAQSAPKAMGQLQAGAAAPSVAAPPAPSRALPLLQSGPAAAAGQTAADQDKKSATELEVLSNRYNPNFSTEGYDRIRENSFVSVLEEPLSTFSIDVDTASYANVRRFLNSGSLPPPDAVRLEELVNYFSYDYARPRGEEPFGFDSELAVCPWAPAHQLLRIALQAKDIPSAALPPSNLVFLVDVSGSMDEENKLPLVKESLKLLVSRMRSMDRISLVVYAGSAGLVLPPTAGDRKPAILAAIDGLESGGSTAGGEGIVLAYETAQKAFLAQGNNRVILATDGDFNVGASSDGELVRLIETERRRKIFLTVLGFGMGNYQDAKMQKLADAGNGNYAYIDSLAEAQKVLAKQMAGTLYAVAKDLKIQIEFNPARVGSYRLLGYEKRVLATQDFADDSKDAGELGAGASVTALYELIPPAGAGAGRELRYQSGTASAAAQSGELMTLKFRYKKPTGDQSALVERPVTLKLEELGAATPDFRFAAAVTEWGLILRGSEYRGGSSLVQVESLAREARGSDREGYRSEFLKLLDLTRELEGQH